MKATANNEHALVSSAGETMLEHAVNAGHALNDAKHRVGHGKWGEWLAKNATFSERTAQLYMRLAANPQRVADLPEQSIRAALNALRRPRPHASARPGGTQRTRSARAVDEPPVDTEATRATGATETDAASTSIPPSIAPLVTELIDATSEKYVAEVLRRELRLARQGLGEAPTDMQADLKPGVRQKTTTS